MKFFDCTTMPNRRRVCIAAILLALVATAAHSEETISGLPRIVDGDTLVIESQKIRLSSTDAPETDQICLDAERKKWACGIQARDRLADHICNRAIDCVSKGWDALVKSIPGSRPLQDSPLALAYKHG